MGYLSLIKDQAPTVLAPLDDTSGVPANQGSSAAAFLDAHNAVSYRNASSPIGRAMTFGVGHFTGDIGQAVGRTNYTVGAWVRTTSTDATRAYAGNPANCLASDWTNSVLRGFGVHGGKAELTRYTTGLVWVYTAGTTSVNDGRWHLIAAACTADGRITIIVDGVQDAQATPALEFNSGCSFCAYGAGYSAATRAGCGDNFDGDAAGLFIAPVELTPAQMLAAYRDGVRERVSY